MEATKREMSKCVSCNKDVDPEWDIGYELLSPDGDFACSKACADKYKQEKDHFFNVIIQDENTFLAWLNGK